MEEFKDNWSNGDPYEYFMGRWSKLMAPLFLQWLEVSDHYTWLDLGCGTGALSEAITNTYKIKGLYCVDPSAEFLAKAKERHLQKATFLVGSASQIPIEAATMDIVVSGLALNFFPDLSAAFSEMKRVLKPNGIIAAYVWDYTGQMEFLRLFWDAARAIDKEADQLDEGTRFSVCNLARLQQVFEEASLTNIKLSYLTIATVFKNFDDYWQPFLGGQGPAPSYLASLNNQKQEQLKSAIQKKLFVEPDGSIKLKARAIAIQGKLNQNLYKTSSLKIRVEE